MTTQLWGDRLQGRLDPSCLISTHRFICCHRESVKIRIMTDVFSKNRIWLQKLSLVFAAQFWC